jgi:DNA helicase-2/ATP-dependent DNA helicase PcrA
MSNPGSNFKSLDELKERSAQSAQNSASSSDIMVGSNVLHKQFGKGKVTKLEGQGADRKATIFFPHHGAKTVLLVFAKLTILES